MKCSKYKNIDNYALSVLKVMNKELEVYLKLYEQNAERDKNMEHVLGRAINRVTTEITQYDVKWDQNL
jgi:hypothetical protein|tara:strand:- start:85 stop:288 length:204 start_codon:yes stop_codon:yes gene_type:complete